MDKLDILKFSIRKQVEEKNMTISKFEKAAGLKPGSVYNILNGRSQKPSLDLILAISRSLGCSIEELLNNTEQDTPLDPELAKKIILSCLEEFGHSQISFNKFTQYVTKAYHFCYVENGKNFDKSLIKYMAHSKKTASS